MAAAASGNVKSNYASYHTLIEYTGEFTPNDKHSKAFNYAAGAFQALFNPSDKTLGVQDGEVVDKARFIGKVNLFSTVVAVFQEVVCLAKPELSFEPTVLTDKDGEPTSSPAEKAMQEGMQKTIEHLRKVYPKNHPKNQSILVATAIMMKIGACFIPSSWKKEDPRPAPASSSRMVLQPLPAAAPERDLTEREIVLLRRDFQRFQVRQQRQQAAATQRWVGDIYGGARPLSD